MSAAATTSASARRFDRASWLTLAFVLSFAAACAIVAALILSRPGDGCLLDAGSEVPTIYACVGDWPTPLLPGDRIVAVDGVSMGEGSLIRGAGDRLAGRAEAATLPYLVERAGEQVELTVPLGRLDGRGLLRAFGAGFARYGGGWLTYIFVGAAAIFGLAPRSRAAQLLLVAGASGAAVTTLAWTAESIGGNLLAPVPLYAGFAILTTFWGWLLLPTLLLLVLSFPRRVWPLARWPRATPSLLYLLPLLALAATLMMGTWAIFVAALGLLAAAFLVTTVAVTTHTFRRVRDPAIRAQTGWLCLGLMVGIGIYPLLFALESLFPEAGAVLASWMGTVPELLGSAIFALCLGIAITRYRLFDIDIIIKRTLVYTLLTGALVAVYLGGVALAQGLVRTLTGQESDLAIVVATLAVAALFQPLRVRIQAFIDRRFFRRKYDAARILAAHGTQLRNEVDLSRLSGELLGVVDETMRPAQASLWLREPQDRK